jgi:hypothetical protein
MDHTQLILYADATLLARQIESWSKIIQISDNITEQVELSNWEDILSLAEERDKLVEVFFEAGVCQEVLPQISDDLDEIKVQHQVIMKGIKLKQNKFDENRILLENMKIEINHSRQQ